MASQAVSISKVAAVEQASPSSGGVVIATTSPLVPNPGSCCNSQTSGKTERCHIEHRPAEGDDLSAPTTVFFRNVPNNCNAKKIVELLHTSGFKDSYDFLYVPHDFKRLPSLVTLGYFFVNFISHDVAVKALKKFVGFKDWSGMWSMDSTKVLDCSWATQTQGQKACIKRYRNCPVMHDLVPVECKPMVFANGVMVSFGPTRKRIKQPRFKKGYLPDEKSADDVLTDVRHEQDVPHELDDASSIDIGMVEEGCRMEAMATSSSEELSQKDDSLEDTHVLSSTMVWMPDESACNCSKCEEAFTMFRRRHHCRVCGLVCCAECAPRATSRLPTLLTRSQEPTFKRLCKDCARELTSPAAAPAKQAKCLVKNTFIEVKDATFTTSFISHADSFPC
jgi:hypothetical protein